MKEVIRCGWLTNDSLYIKYHDEEWGRPIYDSIKLFEMLCLEGQQAGLAWRTILGKRENYRKTFHNFNPVKVAEITDKDVEEILKEAGVVRHKAKIKAIINNAKAYLELEDKGENFSDFIWSFVGNTPIVNEWKIEDRIPTETAISIEMAQALKKKKFSFVGSKICYAYMQACGLVNDHILDCIARDVTSIPLIKMTSTSAQYVNEKVNLY